MAKPLLGILSIVLVILAAVLSACASGEAGERVNIANIASGEKHIPDRPERGALRVAVAARITPREALDVYQQMLDYLSEKLGRPVEMVQRKTYAEVNDLLRRRLIDAAFVCTQAYVEGKRDFGLEGVAVPVIRGEALYYSYLIVPRDSEIDSLDGLRGRSFAFSDPMSNSGKLVPTYLLALRGEDPDSFFSRYVFTYAHSNSIRSVAQRLVDGAAVDSLIWDYANATNPEFTSYTRVVQRAGPYGAPPIVVPPDTDPDLKARLREILLGMHEDPRGKAIISKAMIDSFALVEEKSYGSIRDMLAYLGGNGRTRR